MAGKKIVDKTDNKAGKKIGMKADMKTPKSNAGASAMLYLST